MSWTRKILEKMTEQKILKDKLPIVVSGAVGATASGVMTGLAGTGLLSTQFENYNISQTIRMGAEGGMLYGAALGLYAASRKSATIINNRLIDLPPLALAILLVTLNEISGMLGYGLDQISDEEPRMSFSESCASFGLGTAVFWLELLFLLAYLFRKKANYEVVPAPGQQPVPAPVAQAPAGHHLTAPEFTSIIELPDIEDSTVVDGSRLNPGF